MLIDIGKIISRYGKPRGIIHIGAHLMEERNAYIANGLLNTIWVEANPKVFERIALVNIAQTAERAFCCAAADADGEVFELKVANNGLSSSILEFDRHTIHHPQVYVTEIVPVISKRMDTLILENFINVDEYDFVNLDIQGAELLALKGFGSLLFKMKYVYTEVNIAALYKNCALLTEMDKYLQEFNFSRVETVMTEYEWGDALYFSEEQLAHVHC